MRILIIEDEKRLADSIKKGLEQESHAVDVSYEGSDGYGMAVIQDYDLIILDLMLPGMDGMEICRKLRMEDKVDSSILSALQAPQERTGNGAFSRRPYPGYHKL